MDKITTLIIDDEILAIEFLQKMADWESLGFHIVGTATTPKEGLSLYQEYHPQLVITDICMPGGNGLEMCQTMKNLNPDIKLIILTSYRDFDYAKTAIQVGVIDYIVKHEITPDMLKEKLQQIYGSFCETVRQSRQKDAAELKHLMLGLPVTPEDLTQLESQYNDSNKIFVLFFYSMPPSGLHAADTTFLEDIGLKYLSDFYINENIYTILFSISRGGYFTNKNSLLEYSSKLLNEINHDAAYLSEDHFCLINSAAQSISNLEHLYTDCRQYLDFVHLLELEKCSCIIDMKAKEFLERRSILAELQETLYQLRSFVKQDDFFNAVELLRHLYSETLPDHASLKDIYFCRESIFFIIENEFKKYGADGSPEFHDFQLHAESCSSLQEIFLIFCQALTTLSAGSMDSKYMYCSEKIRNAIGYINSNYGSNMGISDIAAYIGISNSYLVRLFKEETNETLVDYITEVRISAAKNKLLDKTLRISEVAKKTGFNSSQYFSNVFVKKTGLTPGQYRSLYMERNGISDHEMPQTL